VHKAGATAEDDRLRGEWTLDYTATAGAGCPPERIAVASRRHSNGCNGVDGRERIRRYVVESREFAAGPGAHSRCDRTLHVPNEILFPRSGSCSEAVCAATGAASFVLYSSLQNRSRKCAVAAAPGPAHPL